MACTLDKPVLSIAAASPIMHCPCLSAFTHCGFELKRHKYRFLPFVCSFSPTLFMKFSEDNLMEHSVRITIHIRDLVVSKPACKLECKRYVPFVLVNVGTDDFDMFQRIWDFTG